MKRSTRLRYAAAATLGATIMLAVFMLTTWWASPRSALAGRAPERPLQQPFFPDVFEPNDTAATAKGLTPSPMLGLTFVTTPALSPDDIDWYIVTLDPNRSIDLTATIEGAGALIVEGFDVSGTTAVGTQVGSGSTSRLTIVNNTGSFQQYRARVKNILTPPAPARYRIDYVVNIIGALTPTPIGAAPDAYEPNDSPAEVRQFNKSFINVGQQLTNLNFYTTTLGSGGGPPIFQEGDVDWYFFYGRAGATYRVTTVVQPGVDTEMFIYRPDQLPPDNNFTTVGLIAANDDYQPLDRGSQVIFTGLFDGIYWIKLWNKDQSPRVAGQTYNLVVVEIAPGTPTPTLPPTPFPAGADRFEYNGDFDSATLIAPGIKYDNLNFVPFQPPSPNTVDNDFFRLPVKQGVYYTCETLDLAGGTDTNIIVYNQDRVGIGGNDDISPENKAIGRFESRFTWLSGYTGYAYILVGDVNPPRANEGQIRSYSLICNIGIPATPTPTPNPFPPTATPPPPPPTPPPPENTPTPFPTPRPAQNLIVRPVEPGVLQPTVAPTPTPRTLLIDVQVFNDFNRNGLLDPGEGIAGAPVRLSDESSGAPLGQAFTDPDGRVRFSVVNDGPVRVSVPLFSFSTVVDESPATIRIGVEPMITPPERIP
ncbi:MAG: hypothetical protein KatS3mg053_3087 [Candidatus Roseilinea sp.]|nr:MAG: hypothetical protein KatS3mg053_3087 [Candidatus Roseilinea sp.]